MTTKRKDNQVPDPLEPAKEQEGGAGVLGDLFKLGGRAAGEIAREVSKFSEKGLLNDGDTHAGQLLAWLPDWKKALALRVRAGELSEATAEKYPRGAAKFLAWLPGAPAELRGPDLITAWKADMLKTAKADSVNVWLAGLKNFFSWAFSHGLILSDPAASVATASRRGRSKKKAHKRAELTDPEVKRLLASPDPSTPEGARDLAILTLMAYTGLRTVSVWNANREDLQSSQGRDVLFYQDKGGYEKDSFVVITSPVLAALLAWLDVRGDGPGPLFTSMSNRTGGNRLSRRAIRELVKNYLEKAHVKGSQDRPKTAHSLRHTAITKAIQKGADPLQVIGMSGHANLDMLMRYYHNTERLERPAEDLISYNGNGE
jgi:site-specific recombinase XerD